MVIGDKQSSSVTNPPTYHIKHPQYADGQQRMRTFVIAGRQMPRGQNAETLADAGFYHVGKCRFESAFALAASRKTGPRLICWFFLLFYLGDIRRKTGLHARKCENFAASDCFLSLLKNYGSRPIRWSAATGGPFRQETSPPILEKNA